MVVGICIIQLYLPENHSLKGKRQALNSIKQRVRNKFKLTIAEVGNTELWQRATLAVAYVNKEKREVEALFPRVVSFVEDLQQAEVLNYHTELLSYNLED